MSLALNTDANYTKAPAYNHNPLIRPADLLLGFDYRKPGSTWKTGLVAGQTATTYTQNFGTSTVADDLSWSRSPDGQGIVLTDQGYVTLGYSMPQFANNSGNGRTFMAFGRTERIAWAANTVTIMLSVGWLQSSRGIMLGKRSLVSGEVLGVTLETSAMNFSHATFSGTSFLCFLRADAAGNWIIDLPFMRVRELRTGTFLSVAEPIDLASGGNPGAVFIGNHSNSLAGARRYSTHYASAIWNRMLTNREVQDQIDLLAHCFPGNGPL